MGAFGPSVARTDKELQLKLWVEELVLMLRYLWLKKLGWLWKWGITDSTAFAVDDVEVALVGPVGLTMGINDVDNDASYRNHEGQDCEIKTEDLWSMWRNLDMYFKNHSGPLAGFLGKCEDEARAVLSAKFEGARFDDVTGLEFEGVKDWLAGLGPGLRCRPIDRL